MISIIDEAERRAFGTTSPSRAVGCSQHLFRIEWWDFVVLTFPSTVCLWARFLCTKLWLWAKAHSQFTFSFLSYILWLNFFMIKEIKHEQFFLFIYSQYRTSVFMVLVLGVTILMLFFILQKEQEKQRMKIAVDKGLNFVGSDMV